MIPDFEEVKRQLADLAPIINAFKAEAVQLRIVELVLTGKYQEPSPASSSSTPPARRAQRRKTQAAKENVVPASGTKATKSGKTAAKSGRQSALTTLNQLIADGFFKKGKTLAEMVAYCETKLALHYKQSNFSGPLIRLVRDKHLTREKNAEGQYVYQQT